MLTYKNTRFTNYSFATHPTTKSIKTIELSDQFQIVFYNLEIYATIKNDACS